MCFFCARYFSSHLGYVRHLVPTAALWGKFCQLYFAEEEVEVQSVNNPRSSNWEVLHLDFKPCSLVPKLLHHAATSRHPECVLMHSTDIYWTPTVNVQWLNIYILNIYWSYNEIDKKQHLGSHGLKQAINKTQTENIQICVKCQGGKIKQGWGYEMLWTEWNFRGRSQEGLCKKAWGKEATPGRSGWIAFQARERKKGRWGALRNKGALVVGAGSAGGGVE